MLFYINNISENFQQKVLTFKDLYYKIIEINQYYCFFAENILCKNYYTEYFLIVNFFLKIFCKN